MRAFLALTALAWTAAITIEDAGKAAFASDGDDEKYGVFVWPKPHIAIYDRRTAFFSRVVFNDLSAVPPPELQRAFARYEALILTHPAAAAAGSNATLQVDVRTYDKEPTELNQWTLEMYAMQIDIAGSDIHVAVSSQNFVGALRALETLSQLTWFDFDARAYRMDGLPMKFQDSPRFRHRGVLVDTARHFLPLTEIYKLLDSFSYAKLNVMHWHMVDSQSFPVMFPRHPEMGSKGSYSPNERYDAEDLKAVVQYARDRGIRVMAELDTPGHAKSWCAGQPGICPRAIECPEPLDVSKEETFEVLGDLLDDVVDIFPDTFFHIGGDEVNYQCWNESVHITAWREERGMTLEDAYLYFVKRVQKLATDRGRTIVGWDEIWGNFGTELPKGTIIQNWRGINMTDIAEAEYSILYSNNGYYYLDHEWMFWTDAYTADPTEGVADQSLVIGGEGALWSERIDTSDLMATAWPRLGAIAERMWSDDAKTKDIDDAAARLAQFRCLLNRRGIEAAPLNNTEARAEPPRPASCYVQ
mmetsp:Transcript_28464/g.91129  ORF Transcript_28464/g.91129 Transcript_28464/m.91129 type:complete len:529 (-) Transcript_28464:48-1634(-)|eukprot:CAMPEP_0118874494 /NCGR_PEP_ID=MMETSP1163-20130328/15912_1 /TAXON_ID=124430 /ORGANISM="Phaeomonas parva, Strain CCMP2877" /LENGTH=528 /DNA_ID=CAMNT_0006809885 /DNA_START=85 /DNA_END=1671 /DNA_ORIENTATION=+